MPYNRILTDRDRHLYRKVIEEMYTLVPEMAHTKIGTALVQQAFVYAATRDLLPYTGTAILSAGSYMDTAAELLRLYGYAVYDVDPVTNCDLRTFKNRWHGKFNGVISTSVLEHTANDEDFIADICGLLLPNGYGIMTMDFKDDWQQGERVPNTSNRFYTTYDLLQRLQTVLNAHGCKLIDIPDYSARDTFQWEGIDYSFATYVFEKDIS